MATGKRLVDCRDQVRSHTRFFDEPQSTFSEAGVYKCGLLMHRQENQFGRDPNFAKLVGSFDPGEYRHHYVQYNYVRLKMLCFGDQIAAIVYRPDHFK